MIKQFNVYVKDRYLPDPATYVMNAEEILTKYKSSLEPLTPSMLEDMKEGEFLSVVYEFDTTLTIELNLVPTFRWPYCLIPV